MNQNLCLAHSSPHLTALHSHDCLCGVEAELILSALLTASAASVVMKWFSLRPPPLMAPQVLPGTSGRAKLSSRFLKHSAQRKQLATKSFSPHFRPSVLGRIRQVSTPQVGTRYLHFSTGAHVYTSGRHWELAQRHF